MSGRPRIRRSSWQRTHRPKGWDKYMTSRSAVASHVAPKTGGYRSVRYQIDELRAKEAAMMSNDSVNG